MNVSSEERALPRNLEAERSVLGAILARNASYYAAAKTISRHDFFRDAHARIFDAIAALMERKVAVDFVTVKDELTRVGMLDECGGPGYVAGLVDGVPASTNVDAYAGIVREKARLRAIIYAAHAQLTDAYEAQDPAATIVERGLKKLSAAVDAPAGGLVHAHDAIAEYVAAIDTGALGAPLYTGLVDLDAVTRGFRPPNLVVIAARPSVGKTALALGAADAMAQAGHRVVFFPLETGQRSVAARLLAQRSGVQSAKIERGEANQTEYGQVADAFAREPVPLLIEASAKTVTEIDAWCRQAAQADGGLAAIVVDYLQLLMPERKNARDDTDVADISHALKRLAKEHGIVVIALSQLSRASEDRRDKRPTMSDMRGSGAIEQDCDVGILLYRPEMHSKKPEDAGLAEAIVAKHRDGPTGVVRLAFIRELAKFADLDSHHG